MPRREDVRGGARTLLYGPDVAVVEESVEVAGAELRVGLFDLAEHGLEVSDKTRAEGGASLRSLRQLMLELDPGQNWGDLNKTLTPEGHWLWLCEEHAKAYRQ